MVHELGGRVEQAPAGEFGRSRADPPRRRRHAARRPARRAAVLDEPPRHRLRAAAGVRRSRLQHGVAGRRVREPERGLYGIQFHPEVVHTPYGTEILTRFLRDVAGCQREVVAGVGDRGAGRSAIRAQVGDGRAICGLSGGVDSATAALLVHRAIGDRLTCVFVDHGLMRKDEAEQVVDGLPRAATASRWSTSMPPTASSTRSPGWTTPRRSARSSARSSSASSRRRPAKLEDARFLVQGTLYSDVIESGGDGRAAATIKSHHNVGGLPEEIDFELVEPLRMLFKDEVRAVAAELGLPEQLRLAPAVPGARASRSASSAARSPASASKSSARPTRSSRRRSAPPGSTASSGSPSACCRSSARSASRATSAPTPTRS